MKELLIGIGVFIGGFLLTGVLSSIWGDIPAEFSYYYIIYFAILYLSSVVTICTSLILKELRKEDKQIN